MSTSIYILPGQSSYPKDVPQLSRLRSASVVYFWRITSAATEPHAIIQATIMNPEELRAFCMALEGTTEDFPFGPENLVFRINDKIYLIIDLDQPEQCNVKCDPEKAIQFRDEYPEDVLPGYHMNKKHWNTIRLNGKLPKTLIEKMIMESFQLVSASGPARPRQKKSIK